MTTQNEQEFDPRPSFVIPPGGGPTPGDTSQRVFDAFPSSPPRLWRAEGNEEERRFNDNPFGDGVLANSYSPTSVTDWVYDTTDDRRNNGGCSASTKARRLVPAKCKGKHRLWMFTLNNYSPSQVEMLSALTTHSVLPHTIPHYVGFGYEIAPSTGTPHLQGMIRFTVQVWFKDVASILPTAHWEAANPGKEQFDICRAYCSKDGNYQEFGTSPANLRKGMSDVISALLNSDAVKYVVFNDDCVAHDVMTCLESLQECRDFCYDDHDLIDLSMND